MKNSLSASSVAKTVVEFLKIAEKLKVEKRHSWLSNGDQESVAEHCWQMSLMAMLVANELDTPVKLENVLKMIIIHDLVEAVTGDIPYFEESERKRLKKENEYNAIVKIKESLAGLKIADEIFDLWNEFETGESVEAKLVKAIDNVEVQIQHNLADIATWEPIEYHLARTKMDPHCRYDSFLMNLCEVVKIEAEKKMSPPSTTR